MTTIRAGSHDDFDAAVDVWRIANTKRRGGVPAPEAHEARVRGYRSYPGAFLVVADDAGEIVGMALGMQARADDGAGPPIDGLCHISMVFVHPDRWGEGIGGAVLRGIMREALARGYRAVQLWTHADNARSQRLYERHGFARSGREKADDLGDVIVHFERPLEPGDDDGM